MMTQSTQDYDPSKYIEYQFHFNRHLINIDWKLGTWKFVDKAKLDPSLEIIVVLSVECPVIGSSSALSI